MLKITKITDYALIVLCTMAREPVRIHSSCDIADNTSLKLPTVSKILKILVKSGLIKSYRGSEGGYILAKDSKLITITEVIESIEGPFGITDCNIKADKNHCLFINNCDLKAPWQIINKAIVDVLNNISLNDMVNNRVKI